jgi:hypothetical protein
MMSPEAVVEASLAGLEAGRVRVVAGLSNRILGFLTQRLAPRALARRLAAELYRPRGGAGPAGTAGQQDALRRDDVS